MKQLITILLVAFCSSIAFAQSGKPSAKEGKGIVIYYNETKKNANIYADIYQRVENRLIEVILQDEKKRYRVVDRSKSPLEKIQSEHAYQRSGNVDRSQIVKLGKQRGAKLICEVQIDRDSEIKLGYLITVRLIDIETAEVRKLVDNRQDVYKRKKDLEETSEWLAEDLLGIGGERKKDNKGFQMAAEGVVASGALRGGGGSFIMGYRFNSHIALGAGGSFHGYSGEQYKGTAIPVFADFRVNMLKYRLSPYFAVAGGVCFDRYTNTDIYVDLAGATEKYSEHQTLYGYYHLSAGLHLRCSEAVAIFAGVGYNNMYGSTTVQAGLSITFLKQ